MVSKIKNLFPRFLKNYFHFFQALWANIRYGFPSRKLKVIGVTGTDGKTTTVNLIYYLLKKSGKKVSMVSSINAVVGEDKYETGFHVTTPDPKDVQKFLNQAVKAGSEYMVLEMTSHALHQNRVWGVRYEVGVLTNVTEEHLDYHKSYKKYLRTKAKLLKKAKVGITNIDDRSYEIIKNLKLGKKEILTYGFNEEADVRAEEVKYGKERTNFDLVFDWTNIRNKVEKKEMTKKKEVEIGVQSPFLGDYNVSNLLAAFSVCLSLGLKEAELVKSIKEFNPKIIKGRMEEVDYGQNFRVIIDFAHTPGAFSKVLPVFKSQLSQNGRLIHVFGSAGLRDREKRPKMGEISASYADFVVLTVEDPRTEKVEDIIDQIAKGCEDKKLELVSPYEEKLPEKAYFKVLDRQEAINFAIQKLARKGDLVLITGKGHEESMCFGEEEYPWSDFEAVKKALGK